MKSGNLNFLESSGHLAASNETDLLLFYDIGFEMITIQSLLYYIHIIRRNYAH